MRGLLIPIVAILSLLSVVSSTSTPNPAISYLCDALSTKWGCDPTKYIADQRAYCTIKGQLMSWAVSPVKSKCFVFFAGEESKPVTTYTPDELISINVRVFCRKQRFRGLMLYAVDSQENKTGDWEIIGGDEARFFKPWTANSTCSRVLMHANAELKPYLSTMKFRAPPKGTGKITFRALMKVGDANRGEFYWPLNDLELTEVVPETNVTTFWKLGELGQSCSDVCGAKSGYSCDAQASKSKVDFIDQVPDQTVCLLPLISGCGNDARTYDAQKQLCYFPETNCAQNNRTVAKATCDTKDPKTQRFCACSLSPQPLPNDVMSSANNLQGISALLGLAMFLCSPRLATIFLVFFGLTSAHNWINTQSRADWASLYQPYLPAVSDLPHVSVGPGQFFQVEWQTAHFLSTYFSVVHSKYEDKIATITEDLLRDYIDNAPTSGVLDAKKGPHQKFHRTDSTNLTLVDDTGNKTYLRVVPKGDRLFMSRHPYLEGWIGKIGNPNDNNTFQLEYRPEDKASDFVVSYKSDKYPWLEAVFLYKHIALQAVYPDTTNLFIPGFAGFGRYMVHYIWQSYRDVIDVDYVNHTVANIYGLPSASVRWKRNDHCAFHDYPFAWATSEIVTNESLDYCLSSCARNAGCQGVNVVPLIAPPSVFRFENETDWVHPELYGSDILINWKAVGPLDFQLEAIVERAVPGRYLCYTVDGAIPSDTSDIYTLSKDPEDAVFHSTCYHPFRGKTFPGYDAIASYSYQPSSKWRFESQCLDCAAQSFNAQPFVNPLWNMTKTCINCDHEPKQPPPAVLIEESVVEMNTSCSTTGNCSVANSCAIQLIIPGRYDWAAVTIQECYTLANTNINPNCSNTWWYQGYDNHCFCYAKTKCCGTCSRVVIPGSHVFEVVPTADPTCATGVKSADGKSCCSASCGAGHCNNTPSAATKDMGFCCPTCITRPCSKYGPPCAL